MTVTRGAVLTGILALPFLSVGFAWLLGIVSSALRSTLSAGLLAGTVVLMIITLATVAGGAWCIFIGHADYGYLSDSWWVVFVIIWGVLMISALRSAIAVRA